MYQVQLSQNVAKVRVAMQRSPNKSTWNLSLILNLYASTIQNSRGLKIYLL